MDDKSLRMLEYPKVVALLAEQTSFAPGEELARALLPADDLHLVRERLQETGEAVRLLEEGGPSPLAGVRDVRSALERARIGGILEPAQLLDVAATARTARRLRAVLLRKPELARLAELGARLGAFARLEEEVDRCIGPEGEVLDRASPALARARAELRRVQARLREKLESLVRSAEVQKILQEAIITLRNGRYVLPVRQDQRGALPGIVHDQSASGATVFIEPLPVVELNNQLRTLEAEERREVERVLRHLSDLVRADGDALAETMHVLARLDVAFAKGRLAALQAAVEPAVNDRGWIHVRQGRHPLLRGEVVPIDVWLGRDFSALVITGPNTGGKTVTLKTVGLLTLMAQAGLHVPAAPGTELGVFGGIYADIGDEQSIEQSLSTFSSHMTNIVSIVQRAAAGDLVLLDELGAGTDPTEGAALAMALLEHFLQAGCRMVATTHYSELKNWAYVHPAAENASVEFDVQTLAPTYRLTVGLPGRSNALEIAARLGLSGTILARARALLGREQVETEDLIRGLAEARRSAEAERQRAAVLARESEALRDKYERSWQALQARREEMLAEARREARAIAQEARREIEEMIGALRRQGDRALVERARQAHARVTALAQAADPASGEPERTDVWAAPELREGDAVHIRSLDQEGVVVRPPDATGEVVVQAGIMRVTVKADDLRRIQRRKPARPGAASPELGAGVGIAKATAISPEVHLRGMTVDEALAVCDKYLDDALLAGLATVRIVHGKGTGALRTAVRDYLRRHPRVQSFRLGEQGEGGAGVTVVELDRG